MASNANINRGIQLIIDVIDCKMLKGKYLVGKSYVKILFPKNNHRAPLNSLQFLFKSLITFGEKDLDSTICYLHTL